MINRPVIITRGQCKCSCGNNSCAGCRRCPPGQSGKQGPRGSPGILPSTVTNKAPYKLIRKLGLVATDPNVLTFEPTTNLIEIAGVIVITSITAGSIDFTISWTDENGTPQTGNFIPNGGGPVTGPGTFCYQNFPLMIQAGSSVTISAVVNTGPAVYDLGAVILEFTG